MCDERISKEIELQIVGVEQLKERELKLVLHGVGRR